MKSVHLFLAFSTIVFGGAAFAKKEITEVEVPLLYVNAERYESDVRLVVEVVYDTRDTDKIELRIKRFKGEGYVYVNSTDVIKKDPKDHFRGVLTKTIELEHRGGFNGSGEQHYEAKLEYSDLVVRYDPKTRYMMIETSGTIGSDYGKGWRSLTIDLNDGKPAGPCKIVKSRLSR